MLPQVGTNSMLFRTQLKILTGFFPSELARSLISWVNLTSTVSARSAVVGGAVAKSFVSGSIFEPAAGAAALPEYSGSASRHSSMVSFGKTGFSGLRVRFGRFFGSKLRLGAGGVFSFRKARVFPRTPSQFTRLFLPVTLP